MPSRRGPKAKTTIQRMREGNPGRKPINEDEPKPAPLLKIPSPPSHLTLMAKRHWRDLAPLLIAFGHLTPMEKDAFAVYCQSWDMWRVSSLVLKKEGYLKKQQTKTGPYYSIHPILVVRNRAADDMRKAFAEFGFTPADRVNLKLDFSVLAAIDKANPVKSPKASAHRLNNAPRQLTAEEELNNIMSGGIAES